MTEENFIFIISQPRAGSTLLQSLLSNNSEVNTVSEPWLLLALAPLLKPSLTITPYDYGLCHDAMREYEKKFPSTQWFENVKQLANQFYIPMFEGGYQYIIDKTPRYYEILDIVMELYPNAFFIILKRNPLDVVLSLIKKRSLTKSDELLWNNRDLLNAPFLIQSFLNRQKGNKKVIEVSYESLLKNSEKVIQTLYQALNIPFHREVLELHKNKKVIGKYGDKNIQKETHKQIIQSNNQIEISEDLQFFLKGYEDFLGKDFMDAYGGYGGYGGASNKSKSNLIFDQFLETAKKENVIFQESIYQKFNKE